MQRFDQRRGLNTVERFCEGFRLNPAGDLVNDLMNLASRLRVLGFELRSDVLRCCRKQLEEQVVRELFDFQAS